VARVSSLGKRPKMKFEYNQDQGMQGLRTVLRNGDVTKPLNSFMEKTNMS
jgi:hypothetical protein